MPLPNGFEIKELADPLFPFSSTLNHFLTTFNLPEFQYEESKDRGLVHDGTGSSLPTSKVYFAQSDPFQGLPLIHLCLQEIPWDRVKRQMLVELQGLCQQS